MSREKPRPIWGDMPKLVKENVVGLLDIKSKMCLRILSKSDNELVDKSEFLLKEMWLLVGEGLRDLRFKIGEMDSTAVDRMFPKNEAIDYFVRIGKIRNHSIKRVFLDYDGLWNLLQEHDEESLVDMKIKCDYIMLTDAEDRYVPFDVGQLTLRILKYLDCRKFIFCKPFPIQYFDVLAQTEQWRNAIGVNFPITINYPIAPFLHLNSIRITVYELSERDGNALIEAFQSKRTANYCATFFQVYTERPLTPYVFIFRNDDVLKLEIVDDAEDNYFDIMVQKFEMEHFPMYALVVKATRNILAGSVCRRDENIADDYLGSPLI